MGPIREAPNFTFISTYEYLRDSQMSMNNHVRSYIYQHNLGFTKLAANTSDIHGIPQKRGHSHDPLIGPAKLQISWDKENNRMEDQISKPNIEVPVSAARKNSQNFISFGTASPQLLKHVLISSRFPFNQCSDFALRETKKSLDTSLRQFVHSKSSIAFMGSLRSCLRESNILPSPMSKIDPRNETNNPQNFSMQDEATNSKGNETKSILISPTLESGPRQMLLLNLNECFHKYLAVDGAIREEDILFQETINYITNLFIQEFLSSGTRDLCLEILGTKESGELECILSRLIEEANEKHIEQGFDDFQDLVSEFVILGEYGPSPRTEDPRFYGAFEKIWRLKPSELVHYDLDTLFAFCSSGKERPYTSVTLFHKLLNDMEEAAMKMNLVRFHFAFRRELPSKSRRVFTRDLSVLENLLRDVAKLSMQLMKEQDRDQKPRIYKKERVRFHEGHVEVYV